jgi:hypothetical protein
VEIGKTFFASKWKIDGENEIKNHQFFLIKFESISLRSFGFVTKKEIAVDLGKSQQVS